MDQLPEGTPFFPPGASKERLVQFLLTTIQQSTDLYNICEQIRGYAQTDKQLNALINDPFISRVLVENISAHFNRDNEFAYRILQTQHARLQLQLQKKCAPLYKKKILSQKDIIMFNTLLTQGLDLNFTSKNPILGITFPLITCVYSRNLGMIQLLLKNGANPNQVLPEGETPLIIAIDILNPKTDVGIFFILAKYSDINRMSNGVTPLIYCIRSRKIPCAKLLIEQGADPIMPDADNKTPLLLAEVISKMSPEMLEIVTLIKNAIAKKSNNQEEDVQ